jgi:hypothetical protein
LLKKENDTPTVQTLLVQLYNKLYNHLCIKSSAWAHRVHKNPARRCRAGHSAALPGAIAPGGPGEGVIRRLAVEHLELATATGIRAGRSIAARRHLSFAQVPPLKNLVIY